MSGTPIGTTTQEKIHRLKTKVGDTQSGYLEEKVIGSEYITITEEDGSVGKRLKYELDATAVTDGILDHKVSVVENDPAQYLSDKLTEGNAITITANDVGGYDNLEIAASYTGGTGIDITDDEISLDAELNDLNDVVIGATAEGQLVSYDSGTSKFVNTDYAMETTFRDRKSVV